MRALIAVTFLMLAGCGSSETEPVEPPIVEPAPEPLPDPRPEPPIPDDPDAPREKDERAER